MDMKNNVVSIGLVGFGLDTYWPQFYGLLDKLKGFQEKIAQNIQRDDANIVNVGIVDSQSSAIEAARRLKSENVEALFVFVATYSLSSTLLPVVRTLNIPVILSGLLYP